MKGIGREFIEKTKYHNMDRSDQVAGVEQPPLEQDFDTGGNIIKLPIPDELVTEKINLRELIENRRSVRKYSKKALTSEELSYLLWCTQGIKETIGRSATIRTVPSAGARHAIETYLLVNNVEGIKPGLYTYAAGKHSLVQLDTDGNVSEMVIAGCLGQGFIGMSAVTFIWTTVIYRMTWRYGERGYRYIHLDAGHICQNLYLAAESIGCGACAIAAFSDDEVNRILGIDGERQFVLYLATVGKK